MLNILRDNVRRLAPLLWLVIAAFVILMFWEVGNTQPTAGTQTAATVAGSKITFSEFESTYRNLEARFRSIYGEAYTPELAEQLGVPMQAIQSLVQQKLVAREAQRVGLQATQPEVRQAIFEVPALQDAAGNFIGYDEYKRLLTINRIREDQFEADLTESVLLEKFQRFFGSAVWVSDADAQRAARADAERAAIRFLLLDPDNFAAADLRAEESELQAYFDANQNAFATEERRRIAYFHINTNVLRAELEIPEEELRRYYDDNQDEFSQEEQVRARHILLFVTPERSAEQARAELDRLRTQIESGADFGELARQVSEDEASASRGGDLGFFPRGRMTAAFEEAAFGAEAGQLIGPIENQLGPRTGFHLIDVQSRRDGGQQPFAEVENRIRVRLLNERAREQAEQIAQQVSTSVTGQSYESQADLEAIADGLDARATSLQVLEPFALDDTLPGIGQSTPFSRTAFALAPGSFSEPVRIASGWAVLALLEVEESRVPALEEVSEAVRAAVLTEKRRDAAAQKLTELRAQLDAGDSTFDAAAEALELTAIDGGEFDRNGSIAGLGIVPAVNRAALALEQGAFGGPLETERGLVLFEVTLREHFDPVAFESGRNEVLERLSGERANALLQALIEERRNQSNVTYSQQLIQNFNLGEGPGT
jgi:peptidyl-prolyl cis-trans isomerase D